MKKLCCVCLACAMLLMAAAVAERSDFAGIWYLKSLDMPGAEDWQIILVLNEDGTCANLRNGDMRSLRDASGVQLRWTGLAEMSAGSWTYQDGAAYVEGSVGTISADGTLALEAEGMPTMTFSKEPPEGVSKVAADASMADLDGEWDAVVVRMMDAEGKYVEQTVDEAPLSAHAQIADGFVRLTMNGAEGATEVIEDSLADSSWSIGFGAKERLIAFLYEDGSMTIGTWIFEIPGLELCPAEFIFRRCAE